MPMYNLGAPRARPQVNGHNGQQKSTEVHPMFGVGSKAVLFKETPVHHHQSAKLGHYQLSDHFSNESRVTFSPGVSSPVPLAARTPQSFPQYLQQITPAQVILPPDFALQLPAGRSQTDFQGGNMDPSHVTPPDAQQHPGRPYQLHHSNVLGKVAGLSQGRHVQSGAGPTQRFDGLTQMYPTPQLHTHSQPLLSSTCVAAHAGSIAINYSIF